MYIEQLYTNCLAEAAYYIESEGEAVIIDPLRETEPYTSLAAKRGAKIKYVLETHFHADFVSGHIDLARATGATIVYGPGANAEYAIHVAHDGEEFQVGRVRIRVLHTPGHTLESTCYLLKDEAGQPHAVFTGDTLFVGDVGRPDLAVSSELTSEDLAGMLYDSLRNKLMTLPDNVTVYPGHGAGSACGKNIGSATFSTIGQEKLTNYALKPQTREAFVAEVTNGLPTPPPYFFAAAQTNKAGYQDIDAVMARNLTPLTADQVATAINNGALVLDVRSADDFAAGHIPGAVNIGVDGQYAVWVGALIPVGTRIVVVADPGREREAILRLARVGYENVDGYLDGGMAAWHKAGKHQALIASQDADSIVGQLDEITVLDVRKPSEFETGHLPGALNRSLADLNAWAANLDPAKPYYIHCAGGYRSMIAASMLQAKGFAKPINIRGGIAALRQAGLPIVVDELAAV